MMLPKKPIRRQSDRRQTEPLQNQELHHGLLPKRTEDIYNSKVPQTLKKSVRISDEIILNDGIPKNKVGPYKNDTIKNKIGHLSRNNFTPDQENKSILPKSILRGGRDDDRLFNKSQRERTKIDRLDFRRSDPVYKNSTVAQKGTKLSKRALIPSKARVIYYNDDIESDDDNNNGKISDKTQPSSVTQSAASKLYTKRNKSIGSKPSDAEIKDSKLTDPKETKQTNDQKSKQTDFRGSKPNNVKTKQVDMKETKQSDHIKKSDVKIEHKNVKDPKLKGDKDESKEKETDENSKYLIIAAIDFGTTYSGYAFSSVNEYKKNPMGISAKLWSCPHYNSVKTSSNILFDENRQFHSFGFEAEAKYLRLLEDDSSDVEKWYYFSKFKMMLYQNMNIGMNTKLKDIQGKNMSALKVFAAAIGYLKADLLAMCYQQHAKITPEEIRWVITVPSLWNDKAKTFMRKAANKAGIANDSLIMALEPEAASLYCIEWMKKSDATELTRGEKFLVLDAGGGTVDIAVHQIQENGRIRQLHKASGGDWGGIKVDYEFRKLLLDTVGREVLSEIENYYKSDYIDVFYSFERAKRRDFSAVGHGKVQLAFPSIFNQLCTKMRLRDINHLISENMKLKGNMRLVRDKLEIDLVLFKSLFAGAIKDILNHLTILLRQSQVQDLTTILMVGGYSECYLLQEAIQNKFESLRVLVPQDSVLSVLKGAVLYGHTPRAFQSRISTFTYGVETTEPFEHGHPVDRKIKISGKYHCDNIFCVHVRDGENVTLGKSVSKTYKTIDPDQTHMEFVVFASINKNPKYTDESGCFKLGTLTVDVSKMTTDKYGVKKVRLELIYGGTELEAVAIDTQTGKTSHEHFELGPVTRRGEKVIYI